MEGDKCEKITQEGVGVINIEEMSKKVALLIEKMAPEQKILSGIDRITHI